MDIRLSDDQVEIARQARRFCENESPMEFVREMFEDERGITDEVWQKMVEMGWTAMRVPEEHDGLGLELMDLAVVFEEMGRGVVPGPLFSTALLVVEIIKAAGGPEQQKRYLPAIAAGELRGALALHERDGGGDLDYIELPAELKDGGYVLDGVKLYVPDAHLADILIVPARTGEDVTLFLVNPSDDGVKVEMMPSLDGTRKLCAVTFNRAAVPRDNILGAPDRGRAPLMAAVQCALVGLCAESVGGAQRALEIANEYAKERVQFDQPIGAYQSIKHRLAQMFVEVESARSLLYWAAWAQDHADAGEAAQAASVAKVYCSDAFTHAASGALQILGGTGFTWEHDIHLYLKRAKANELSLGDPAYHREHLLQLLTSP